MSLVPTIGLEVHCQLATQTKMFCSCPLVQDAAPNTAVCPVCMGHPGALPVVNHAAIGLGVRAGLALGCTIHAKSIFARKHYFYPDLSKGYQISQFDRPLCTGGRIHLELDGSRQSYGIHRIHLEEDAGKMRHGADASRLDWNRGGTPLIEIVGDPDLHSSAQAGAWLRMLHRVVVCAGVTSGDMEKGHFRCDANVSLGPKGGALGTRVELKNINSFRFVERALDAEIARQRVLLERGESVIQATRTWNGQETILLRTKEEAADYRYFPDPDLPALVVEEDEIEAERETLLGAPLDLHLLDADATALQDFLDRYGLQAQDGAALLAAPALRVCFEAAVAAGGAAGAMANWVRGPVSAQLNAADQDLSDTALDPAHLVALEALVEQGEINRGSARKVLSEVMRSGTEPAQLMKDLGLSQIGDTDEISAEVDRVIAANPDEIRRYRAGEKKLFGFLLGQVMRGFSGRANPQQVRAVLESRLDGV